MQLSSSERRRKQTGPQVRAEALAVARRRLIQQGPHAVTLANVGDELGMTHANVLYHFGSAAGLQSALMVSMINDLAAALRDIADMIRDDPATPLAVVDRIFDAFGEGGAGPVAAWIIMSGNIDHLEPLHEAVHSLLEAIVDRMRDSDGGERARHLVLMLAVMAFGDAVIGPHIRGMLDARTEAMRDLVAEILPNFLPPTNGPPAKL